MSREQVVNAAIRTIESGQFEQMTIRSLAAELGVAPMTLYRHVRDKDDLLDEVVDHLMRRVWRPPRRSQDWRLWWGQAAEKLRGFLVSQPAALYVYLRHPVVSPVALERMEAMLDVLRSAGAAEQDTQRAYGAVHTYTIGFAALEASRARWVPDPEASDILVERLAAFTTPRQFAEGLGYLLDGIDSCL